MVLYTYHRVRGRGAHDEYWKLENHRSEGIADLKTLLRDRKYHFVTSSDKNRLLNLLSRQARGLISYDACKTLELKNFCINRGLLTPTKSQLPRASKIRLLEDADENTTFTGFTDLPPEIRLHIYSLYFSSLPNLARPTQPPIAKVSRLIRTESLPVFYKTCNFIVESRLVRTYSSRPMNLGILYLSHLSETHLAIIRHLMVETSYSIERVEWDNGSVRTWSREGRSEAEPCPLSAAVMCYLKNVRSAPHGKGLTKADVAEIGKLMAGGPFQLSS